jgi:hypothetical protein
MPTAPLWRIPDPAALALQGEARREAIAKERIERDRTRVAKRAERVRLAGIRMQRETERRARERAEWFATHEAPSADELERLRREKAPALAAAMEKGKGR